MYRPYDAYKLEAFLTLARTWEDATPRQYFLAICYIFAIEVFFCMANFSFLFYTKYASGKFLLPLVV